MEDELNKSTDINKILKLTCPICTPSASCSPTIKGSKAFEF